VDTQTLNRRAIEYLAVANSGGDLRTVRKILNGKRAKGDVDTRIRRALLAMGVTPLITTEAK
jgi:SOS response regulatory protein OraA/RecX